MIKKLGVCESSNPAATVFRNAEYPSPFYSGLEYASPARGTWNIVHTGMLIPEAHQIFVCAEGCLRGVVLTAAELGLSERFSTIAVSRDNIIVGDNEEIIIEGVTEIINKLPKKPRAILIYTSCLHHFVGCDLSVCYRTLRERFPDIHFTDCYMNPIMRKSGITPDAKMRIRLYDMLKKTETSPKTISFIGSDFSVDEGCEIYSYLIENGFEIRQITTCKTFEEYQRLSEASVCITTFPAAIKAGKELEKRLGQRHLHLPFSFCANEIIKNYETLCNELGIECPDYSKKKDACERALAKLKDHIGNTPIVIDYTAFSRPLSLSLLLLDRGFNVTRLYCDGFTPEEKEDFQRMKSEYPEVELYPTVHTSMRVEKRITEEKTLAIGQKAAYFCGTEYFVNIVENGGYYGFEAILRLCDDIRNAYDEPKDTRALIQVKGMGCCGCAG